MMRQSRWREAIASIFDDPDYLPYLRSVRRIAVTYGTHDESGAPGSTNIVKPVYHVVWLASRLGMHVAKPLAPVASPARPTKGRSAGGAPKHRGMAASLADGRADVAVVIRPLHLDAVRDYAPRGAAVRTTRVGAAADVTAEAEAVHVRAWVDGVEALDRHCGPPGRRRSPRRVHRGDAPRCGLIRDVGDGGEARGHVRQQGLR